MKPKNSNLRKGILLPGVYTVLIIAILIFSCKKNSADPTTVKNDMAGAATVLGGEMFSGTITTQSNENGIALNYNNGNKIVFIENLEGVEPFRIADVRSAEVITSEYGVILKDVENDKVYILTNNDPKSIKIAEDVKSLFSMSLQSILVYGVTIVNAEKV